MMLDLKGPNTENGTWGKKWRTKKDGVERGAWKETWVLQHSQETCWCMSKGQRTLLNEASPSKPPITHARKVG